MINPRYPYNPEEFSDFFDQAVEGKQDTLVSGENIKTINGESILGSGDLTIEGGGGTPSGYYAQYQDNITQTAAVANTGYPIKFRTLDYSNGVSVVSNSRITIANTGIYNLQFSVQLENSSTQEHDVTIWLRKNGTDVAGSAGFVAVVSSHGGTPGHCIPSWNYLLDAVGGDYYELVWSVTNTAVTMPYYAGANPPPSAASAIFTVTQQAGIMAGTGMTALNGLTDAVQTISTGTTGSDFNVASSGTIHTFNIPTASATTRGALSTTDWSAFNGKQAALVSGTNIKTINSTSLLGSGDVAVQPTLVSGTSIKTVNGTSLLGSGDLTTNPRTLASVNGSNLIGVTNQISASVLIPAGTISTNNTIYIKGLLTKTAGSSTSTPRVYINTTNSLTGATLLAAGILMNTTVYFQRFERNFYFDGTNLNGYSSALSTGNDYASSAITLTAFNPATAYYLIFAVQNSSTTPDNLGWRRVIVQIYD